ncbi:hypothetical protein C2G38_2174669 [Gigaspora rosea]|uniref:Uncharacterized protein n=1 Tax=Gigaspora rosea TaxID=44941 RepID=A0A397VJX9_9GLOM|nr:hypothetical protein C2G38_2174669 [Gigaspora rosea]
MFLENVTYKNNTPIQRSRKKLVATASGHSYYLNLLCIIYAIMTYPLEILIIMPRILKVLKEAFKLHYYKNLGIYHRPIPIEGTVVKLDPNFIDSYAQEIITKYLFYLVSKHTSIIHIIIHLPDPNIPPIQIYPNYNEHAFQNIKHIKVSLHNYSFFTNLLIKQNLYRALLIRYFEKAWDCDDLPALIDLLFNYSIIFEDDFKGQMNSGSIKSTQGFDERLHSLLPAVGVDQAFIASFIASIAQNDICFDLRLKAIIILQYLKKGGKNKIFINANDNKLELMTLPSPLPRKDEKLK